MVSGSRDSFDLKVAGHHLRVTPTLLGRAYTM